MNLRKALLLIVSSTWLVAGLALAANTDKTASTSTDAKTEQAQPPAKKKKHIPPHSHPRDAKGIWVPDKSNEKDAGNKPANESKK